MILYSIVPNFYPLVTLRYLCEFPQQMVSSESFERVGILDILNSGRQFWEGWHSERWWTVRRMFGFFILDTSGRSWEGGIVDILNTSGQSWDWQSVHSVKLVESLKRVSILHVLDTVDSLERVGNLWRTPIYANIILMDNMLQRILKDLRRKSPQTYFHRKTPNAAYYELMLNRNGSLVSLSLALVRLSPKPVFRWHSTKTPCCVSF